MEWRNKHGRLWQGDCLDLMGRIPAGRIGMVFADLPYGVTECKWDTVLPFERLWPDWARVGAPGVAVVLTATQPFASACVMSKPAWFKHEWVWDKRLVSGFQNAKHKPLAQHELVLVFSIDGGRVRYTPIKLARKHAISMTRRHAYSDSAPINGGNGKHDGVTRLYTEDHPKDIISIPANRESGGHPTQKPVALLQYLIKTYTQPGDVILDPTAGSGTTAIAAMNTGRRFVCIEKDPDIYAGMVARVEKHVKKLKNSLGALDR